MAQFLYIFCTFFGHFLHKRLTVGSHPHFRWKNQKNIFRTNTSLVGENLVYGKRLSYSSPNGGCWGASNKPSRNYKTLKKQTPFLNIFLFFSERKKARLVLTRNTETPSCVHIFRCDVAHYCRGSTRMWTVEVLVDLHIPLCFANIPLFMWIRKWKWRISGPVNGFIMEISGYQKTRDRSTHPIHSATHATKLVWTASKLTGYACSESTPRFRYKRGCSDGLSGARLEFFTKLNSVGSGLSNDI